MPARQVVGSDGRSSKLLQREKFLNCQNIQGHACKCCVKMIAVEFRDRFLSPQLLVITRAYIESGPSFLTLGHVRQDLIRARSIALVFLLCQYTNYLPSALNP